MSGRYFIQYEAAFIGPLFITMKYITKDSGKKDKFSTGYQRDAQEGKTRYDLIPPKPLTRVADLYARGAEKYGDSNWAQGAPFMRQMASILRHLYQWRMKDNSEDHLAAVIWGCFSLMYYEEQIEKGTMDKLLDDREKLL